MTIQYNKNDEGDDRNKGKYHREFFKDSYQKGGRGPGVNHFGESVNRGSGNGLRNNGVTDPNSAVTIRRTKIKVDSGYIFGYVDINGDAIEGELKTKTEIYNELGEYLGKKDYIALDYNISDKEWKTSKAMEFQIYRKSQIKNCIKRENGFFYSANFVVNDYSEFIKIASQDRDKSLRIIGFDEETNNKLLEEILNSSHK